jgi:hypothetical protein
LKLIGEVGRDLLRGRVGFERQRVDYFSILRHPITLLSPQAAAFAAVLNRRH